MPNSLEYIYRFRSTDALLGTRQELENQEIYFASAAELNDPLEGYKDLFWRADAIIWRNFIRHYLLCLMRATLTAAISEHDGDALDVASFIAVTEEDLAPEHRSLFTKICTAFLSDSEIAPLPGLLAERASPIRRSELLTVFWMLHLRALHLICMTIPAVRQLWDADESPFGYEHKRLHFKELLDAFNLWALERVNGDVLPEKMSECFADFRRQGNLIHAYNGLSQKHGIPWRSVLSDFSENYVNALEMLLFYETYTASFVSDPFQASMWSTYGDQHRGCCLKFSTKPTPEGSPSLDLYHFKGESSSLGGTRLNFDYGFLPLQKVEYKDQLPEIDFFRNMGCITPRHRAFWCQKSDGTYDQDAATALIADESSRAEYWKAFDALVITKLRDWQHEAEYRSTLHSMIHDISEPGFRKLKYRFEDLDGVIFGIKTKQQEKLAIMRVIETKCRKEKRLDFKFYQAYYSRRSGRIEVNPLDLIRFAH